ncbi:MAG: biopolymer transport protein ExbB [Verrucomicrobiales bacterium]|jgi:biopolymer transport protein ExbB
MSVTEIFAILSSGGWIMILLAVLALILYVTAFGLIHSVYSGNLNSKSSKHWLGWIKNPDSAEGRVGEIIRYTQQGKLSAKRVQQRFEEVRFITASRVSHRLLLLNTLVAAAPLAGLLGTVIGMLGTFGALAAGGNESMARVAGGIHEALLTTQTGLLIALPGVFASLMINRRRQALEAGIAQLESLTLIHKTGLDAIDEEEEVIALAPARRPVVIERIELEEDSGLVPA